jgi:hypothetical protein
VRGESAAATKACLDRQSLLNLALHVLGAGREALGAPRPGMANIAESAARHEPGMIENQSDSRHDALEVRSDLVIGQRRGRVADA